MKPLTVPVAERLELIPFTLALAHAVLAGDVPRAAEGFPTEGDLVVAGLVDAAGADPIPPWCPYLLVERESGSAIGGAGFVRGPREGEAEIGYGLAASARGRGYATEAVRTLCATAAAHGVRVVAATAPGNIASQRVLAAAGFCAAGERDGELLFRWGPA